MHRGKKGSLSLSVEAIVILVMAITMLGLGLGFIKSKFGQASETFGQVTESVKEQIKRDFAKSDTKSVMTPLTPSVNAGGVTDLYLGVKNKDTDTKYFAIVFAP